MNSNYLQLRRRIKPAHWTVSLNRTILSTRSAFNCRIASPPPTSPTAFGSAILPTKTLRYLYKTKSTHTSCSRAKLAPTPIGSKKSVARLMMEEAQRKIELQAPDDLSYLLANVRRAAAARLDEAFPPVDGADAAAGDDELRTRIEKLVDEYITKTFTLAIPNLSINGLPIGDPAYYLSGGHGSAGHPQQPEEVYEPFDARKRARVEELTREEEDLLRDIAQLKKTVPQAAAAAWAESARRSVADDERALAAANDRSIATTAATAAATTTTDSQGQDGKKKWVLGDASSWGLERQDDVEDSYTDAVMGLDRLKRETPAVVARMERAKSAGEYVITER